MIFGEITSILSLWDRFSSLFREKKIQPAETIVTRFIKVFESHGVHRNQIPRFIGHGLTLADVHNNEILLPKLTEVILDDVCNKFAIRREWLDGAESQIYLEHDFYKHPAGFQEFIDTLMDKNPGRDLRGVLISPEEKDSRAGAIMVLQETIGSIGNKAIYRYHICNNWVFSYWKARAYLAACIAIAWKNEVYIHGVTKSKAFIDELSHGKALLGWGGEGIWGIGHRTWDPEDMALQPDVFLDGIDAERNNYGLKSALSLWLELEKRGLMDLGFGVSPREIFEEIKESLVKGDARAGLILSGHHIMKKSNVVFLYCVVIFMIILALQTTF